MRRTFLAKESCILLMLATVNVYSQTQADNGLKQVASYTSTIQVDKGIQSTNVEATLFIFIKEVTADKKFIAEVLVLREAETGLSWWSYQERSDVKSDADSIAKSLSNKKIYLSDDVIGCVGLSYNSLWVRESSEKYSSMTEAKHQVLTAFNKLIPGILQGTGYLLQDIEVAKYIPFEFYYGDFNAIPRPYVKLDSVRIEGKAIVVSLSGWNNTKLDIEVNGQHQVTKLTSYPEHKAKN